MRRYGPPEHTASGGPFLRHCLTLVAQWLPTRKPRTVHAGQGLKTPCIGYSHSTRDTIGQAPCSSFRFQRPFLLRNVDRGVIDLKENCGLYLSVGFEHAGRICHIERYVFGLLVCDCLFFGGRLLAWLIGLWVFDRLRASPLLPCGRHHACKGVSAHALSTPRLTAQDRVWVC